MGAGDVTMLGAEILAALQLKANRSAPRRPGDGVGMTEPTEHRSAGRADRRTGARSAAPSPPTTPTPRRKRRRHRRLPRTKPTSRDRGAGRAGNARNGAPPRPARPLSSRPAARPSGASPATASDEKAWPRRGSGPEGADVVGADQCGRRRARAAAVLHADHVGAQHRRHRAGRGDRRKRSSPRRRWPRARRCCRSTPTRSPSGWPRSGGSPAPGCSGSTRRRCGSPSSSGFRWWSRTIPTVRTCSTATAWISRPRRRRRACRTSTPRIPARAIRRPRPRCR